MTAPRPQVGPVAPQDLDRPRAMLRASGMLVTSAILMAMGKRGVFDGELNLWSDLAGLILGACGFVYLIYIWRADRFRVSIGRLMVVTAIIAVLFQGARLYVNWLRGG
jgi:hypothetical protein